MSDCLIGMEGCMLDRGMERGLHCCIIPLFREESSRFQLTIFGSTKTFGEGCVTEFQAESWSDRGKGLQDFMVTVLFQPTLTLKIHVQIKF